MIGMNHLWQNAGMADVFAQRVAHHIVIDAPAFVVFACVGPEAPPGIMVGHVVDVAEAVGKAGIDKFGEPGPFFGQKA